MSAPELREEHLDNDTVLLGIIDELLAADRTYWRHTRAIVRAQLRLQEVVTEEAFTKYLDIEERVNAKVNFVTARVVAWAFLEGRKAALRE